MIKLVTIRDNIRAVAASWRKQQAIDSHGVRTTYSQLNMLNPETDGPADVAAIIGNDWGTQLVCDECGRNVDAVVRIGEEPWIDSATVEICRECTLKALAAFAV